MKPKLTLTIAQMKNFNIDVINKMEGCPEAMVYLFKMYGSEVADLRTRGQDFINLIHTNKELWAMNFILNLLKKPYRAKFTANAIYEELEFLETSDRNKKVIKDMLIRAADYATKPTKKSFAELADDYSLIIGKRSEVQKKIKAIGVEAVTTSQDYFHSLQRDSQFYKALCTLLEHLDGSLTRDSVKVFQCLAESVQWRNMKTSGLDHHKLALQKTAKDLIEYSEAFN